MEILIRTGKCEATVERGACFLPTIEKITPNGFTTPTRIELEHGSLIETLSPCSTTVRDKGYSPPPTRTWQLVFSAPRKEVCTSTSSVTRQT
jgi:hypothetical protein